MARAKDTPRQQHLNRELSALQLDSPAMLRSGGRRDRGTPRKAAAAARRGAKSKGTPQGARAVDTPRKTSGEVSKVRSRPPPSALTPRKQLRSSAAKSSSLLKAEVRVVAERIRGMDRRVAKQAEHLSVEVDALRADVARAVARPKSKEAAARCLRPRNEAAAAETPSRKRKRSELAEGLPSKSPKVASPSPRSVMQRNPQMSSF